MEREAEQVALAKENIKLAQEKAALLEQLSALEALHSESKSKSFTQSEPGKFRDFEVAIAALEEKNAAVEMALGGEVPRTTGANAKPLEAGGIQQALIDVATCDTEDDLTELSHAQLALSKAATTELMLVKDRPGGAAWSWKPVVCDPERRSYAYVLRAEDNPSFSREQLQEWFQALHPSTIGIAEGAWTDAHYKGEMLLRKTAWCTLQEGCTCEYGS